MSTDASYRFERGVDPLVQRAAARRCAELILAVAGGSVEPAAPEVAESRGTPPKITLRRKRAEQVLGKAMPVPHMTELLESIGFRCSPQGEDALEVEVPGHRIYDVAREDDLVEEVARRHGYDNFPDDVRPFRPGTVPPDAMAVLEDRLRTLLVARGFLEARGAAFAPPAEGDLALMLPLASTESHLRRALLPGLLHRVEANFNRGARDVRLFEIGTAFAPGGGDGLPLETTRIAVAFTGARAPEHWSGGAGAFDLWDLKDLLTAIAAELGGTVAPDDGSAGPPFDPAASFRASDASGELGRGGGIAPAAIDAPPWASPVFGLELVVRPEAARSRAVTFSPLPGYPAIERDLALVADRRVAAAAIEATVRAAAGPLLEDAHVFDVYEGTGVAEGARSVAFRLRFRAPDRTLTDEEVDVVVERILERLRDEHDIRRR
jgi:phenylalanyl-tRNA synthetase beta chain